MAHVGGGFSCLVDWIFTFPGDVLVRILNAFTLWLLNTIHNKHNP